MSVLASYVKNTAGEGPTATSAASDDGAPRLRVMPDYNSNPLWIYGGPPSFDVDNPAPEDLGLSTDLARELDAWAEEFDAILVRDDPARSAFSSPDAEAVFVARGRALARRVWEEIGDRYAVVEYLDTVSGSVEETPGRV
jgi:hypothetical protein